MAQLAATMPGTHEALGLTPAPHKPGVGTHAYYSSTQKVILGYIVSLRSA